MHLAILAVRKLWLNLVNERTLTKVETANQVLEKYTDQYLRLEKE
jgi:hypothetical protein